MISLSRKMKSFQSSELQDLVERDGIERHQRLVADAVRTLEAAAAGLAFL